MAAYSHYLGAMVTVQYRLGDILLSAAGMFAADSGRSIFLEQHVEQRGRRNYFRWEIPYGSIHSIESACEQSESPIREGQTAEARQIVRVKAAGAGVCAPGEASSAIILPLANPP